MAEDIDELSDHYFHEGSRAFQNGESMHDNPYVDGTYESQEWWDGWDSARQKAPLRHIVIKWPVKTGVIKMVRTRPWPVTVQSGETLRVSRDHETNDPLVISFQFNEPVIVDGVDFE